MIKYVKAKPLSGSVRFNIVDHARYLSRVLDVDLDAALETSKIPNSLLYDDKNGVSAEDFLRIWSAIENAYDGPDFISKISKSIAYGWISPATLAFTYSKNIIEGLARLSEFEPLIGPFALEVKVTKEYVDVRIHPAFDHVPFPASFSYAVAVVYLEKFRRATATPLSPICAGLPAGVKDSEGHFDCDIVVSDVPWMRLSLADAKRPLVSENSDHWKSIEPELRRKLSDALSEFSTSQRVKNELEHALPTGDSGADTLSRRLGMSKRSLHRKLQVEGVTFNQIKEETRSELACILLQSTDLAIEEVSLQLGFQRTTSFSRAFKRWFEVSPRVFRAQNSV